MSSSSQLSMLPAKRSLKSHLLDSQFFLSKCKVRKISSTRRFPPNCGRFNQDKKPTKAYDVPASIVSSQRSVNQNTLNGNETPHGHNVGSSGATDADCVRLSEVTLECKPGKIRRIASQICTLVDHILADSTHDDKFLFKLVVEKRESGFRIDWEGGDGEIIVLSHAEWDSLKSGSKLNNEEVDAKRVETEKVDATRVETKKEFENRFAEIVVSKYEGTKMVDFMDLDSYDDARFDQQVAVDLDSDIVGSESPGKIERMPKFEEENDLVESSLNGYTKCNMNRDLVNLTMAPRNHPDSIKSRETLELFEEYYSEILYEPKKMNGKGTSQASNQAAYRLKKEGKSISTAKLFGHIPGVEISDKFRFRAELAVVGLHCQMTAGIDYVKLNGKIFATSVVNSGRYENETKAQNVLIYSGQGGKSNVTSKASDQKLERGNLALVNSKEMQYPIRVTFKTKRTKSETVGLQSSTYDYVYDGLYIIDKYWKERSNNCKMVYKFELHRLPEQPRPREVFGSSRVSTKGKEVCVLDDISNGLERVKIRVMNGMDDDKPLPFTYLTKMVYPNFVKSRNPIGCDCINGCSDLHPCQCVKLNGVEIPFNEYGCIIMKKSVVHECGPNCKCPPTCMNRVSQLGLKHHLEIFKTMSMGCGVRSRNYIPIGSFICEYIGEFLHDYDAGERISSDEYLFDIYNDDANEDGFVINALRSGNIGRFFNHSCSPNLFAQEVLYDHGDRRIPHIMFFASTNIPPLKELTYDYDYKIDQVRDKNGNIKKKYCHCGSRECTGRMY